MNLLKCVLTNNPCYKAGKTIIPKGIMVHSTGANNTYLRRYVQPLDHDIKDAYDPDRLTLLNLLGVNKNANDWNHNNREVGVHAFIGRLADGSMATIQTLPWNHRAWHAGVGTSGKSANDTHIAFEICEDGLVDSNYFEQIKREAVDLVAMLCTKYNFDPFSDGVIICHQDGYKRGIANNHSDIYNWWNKHQYTMDSFRSDVNRRMIEMKEEAEDDMRYYKTVEELPEYYQTAIKKLINAKVLLGTGKGELNISEDFCKIFTVLDRLGKL